MNFFNQKIENEEMKINKVEIEEKTKTRSFKVPTEIKEAIDTLDNWLENNTKYEGSLEWDSAIEKEIEKEIKRRNSEPEKTLSKVKVTLSASIAISMRECDKNYGDKGYSPEWETTIMKILARLIRTNTKILANKFKESPPEQISEFYKQKSENSDDQPQEPEYQTELEMEEESETV